MVPLVKREMIKDFPDEKCCHFHFKQGTGVVILALCSLGQYE